MVSEGRGACNERNEERGEGSNVQNWEMRRKRKEEKRKRKY